MINRVRSGNWNPDANDEDWELRNALAARGYWQAYQEVRKSVGRVLANENPGTVADENHGTWYRAMFAPSVTVGLLKQKHGGGMGSGTGCRRHRTNGTAPMSSIRSSPVKRQMPMWPRRRSPFSSQSMLPAAPS